MTTSPTETIAAMEHVAQETFAYFSGPGRTTTARVDRWHARDVLMHFIYFHDATASGIQSVGQGGPPWTLPADTDTINEVCRTLHEHESLDELLTQLRLAHGRLMHAARRSPSLDAVCFKRANGGMMTGRQRLQLLAKHWTEHVGELKAAAAAR